jgi:hypothetical protein
MVVLCQKHSFLYQLTQNITKDCSLNYEFSARKLQIQFMLCISNSFSFSFDIQNNLMYTTYTELIIQRTICLQLIMSASEKG